MCDGISNHHFVANLLLNVTVKGFWKIWVNIFTVVQKLFSLLLDLRVGILLISDTIRRNCVELTQSKLNAELISLLTLSRDSNDFWYQSASGRK